MRLLMCTDLDRTLLPNGAEPGSPDARSWFHRVVALPGVTLAFVTGRDEKLARHVIEFLMRNLVYSHDRAVLSGDSGNDLPVLISAIPSILVRNASSDIKREAEKMAKDANTEDFLYLAQGCFKRMNGNYAAGILEGLAHYHPEIKALVES